MRINTVISELVKDGYIPEAGLFEITDQLLSMYNLKYTNLFATKENVNTEKKPSRIRYEKKLAYLNLRKLNEDRLTLIPQVKKHKLSLKSGYLYVISNPVFCEFVKIGITRDVNKRLQTYQTYDPLRRYKIEHYMFVEDMRFTEKYILEKYRIDISNGEWINSNLVVNIIKEFVDA